MYSIRSSRCIPCVPPMFVLYDECVECVVSKCTQCSHTSTYCISCVDGYMSNDRGECVESGVHVVWAKYGKRKMRVSIKYSEEVEELKREMISLIAVDTSASSRPSVEVRVERVEKDGYNRCIQHVYVHIEGSIERGEIRVYIDRSYVVSSVYDSGVHLMDRSYNVTVDGVWANYPTVSSVERVVCIVGGGVILVLALVAGCNMIQYIVMYVKMYQMMHILLLINTHYTRYPHYTV